MVPTIKHCFTNLTKLTANDTAILSKDVRRRMDRLLLKILDCLTELATFTESKEFTDILFAGDEDLRK